MVELEIAINDGRSSLSCECEESVAKGVLEIFKKVGTINAVIEVNGTVSHKDKRPITLAVRCSDILAVEIIKNPEGGV